jgi:hypothetical protein
MLHKVSIIPRTGFFLILILMLSYAAMGLGLQEKTLTVKDTTLVVDGIPVGIRMPEAKVNGFILVLPGWNFSRNDVCRNSDFCHLAKEAGYCLILPEMGKSAYILRNYKETREDYRQYLKLSWVIDSLIPFCQKTFGILLPGENNFIFGISTGGRGVAQVAIHTGRLFTAGAALSGDYNQLLQPADKLMTGYLGPAKEFPERWSGEDNPCMHAEMLKIPLYLGHGKADKIVPSGQSVEFFERIKSLHPDAGHILHIAVTGGHDYNYWNSEMQRIFAFFYEKRVKR